MRPTVLVNLLALLLVISLSLFAQQDPSPESNKPTFIGVLMDFLSNPGKYISYIEVVINIFIDYLHRIKYKAKENKNKLLRSLSYKGNDNRERTQNVDPEVERHVNAIVNSISAHLAEVLPTDTPITDHEFDFKARYACVSKGKLSDLKTIRRKSTVIVPNGYNDSLDIYLSFYLEELHVKFDNLVMRTSALGVRKGTLAIDVEDNEIKVHLSIPSTSTVLDRIFKMQCIINVESVKLEKLKREHVRLHTNGLFRGHISQIFVKEGLHLSMDSVLQNVIDSIYEAIMDNLDTSGWWICRKKGTRPEVEEVPFTDLFKRYCMEEDS